MCQYYKRFLVSSSFSFSLGPKIRQLWIFHAFSNLGSDLMILFVLFSILHNLFLGLEGDHEVVILTSIFALYFLLS
jgi:hypothetical protein